MANWFNAIHSCQNDEIVVHLDGDDWLAHDHVLSSLNTLYSASDIWVTYGQYMRHPSGALGDVNESFPQYVVKTNQFRRYHFFPVSHLRAHYAWLFKLVKLEHLVFKDYYYLMACDKAMMAPMLEMASLGHFAQITDVLYIYNMNNPINNNNINVKCQFQLAEDVLKKDFYSPLNNSIDIEQFDNHDHVTFVMLFDKLPGQELIQDIRNRVCPMYTIFLLVPKTAGQQPHPISGVQMRFYEQSWLIKAVSECLNEVDSSFSLRPSALSHIYK